MKRAGVTPWSGSPIPPPLPSSRLPNSMGLWRLNRWVNHGGAVPCHKIGCERPCKGSVNAG
jgi:hypothetical protein